MARKPSGAEHIVAARRLMKAARTADELRMAQAVLLPLDLGLSIAQTAAAIGRSAGATSTMRNRFIKDATATASSRPTATKSHRAHRPADGAIHQALQEILGTPRNGGVTSLSNIKPALEARLGKTLAQSSMYRTLARIGWTKNASGEWSRG